MKNAKQLAGSLAEYASEYIPTKRVLESIGPQIAEEITAEGMDTALSFQQVQKYPYETIDSDTIRFHYANNIFTFNPSDSTPVSADNSGDIFDPSVILDMDDDFLYVEMSKEEIILTAANKALVEDDEEETADEVVDLETIQNDLENAWGEVVLPGDIKKWAYTCHYVPFSSDGIKYYALREDGGDHWFVMTVDDVDNN